ncbi:MAG: hypothetical protein GY754_37765, partial [bacterium]|nr:hypothetical protein [bacterium]
MKKHIIIFLFAIMLLTIFCGCGLGGNAVSESIRPDSTPPVVSITSPDNGNIYGSGTIVIQGKAADDLKIIKVEISIDGGSYTESNKQGFSSNSLELDWIDYVDTSTLSNGLHTITARATDLWDNTNTVSIDIIVDNGAPLAVISGVPPLLSDTDYLNAAVSGEGIVAYKYKLDIADWSPEISVEVPVSASGLGVGEHTLLIIGKKIVDGKEVWQDATEEVTKYVWSVNTQYYFSASD